MTKTLCKAALAALAFAAAQSCSVKEDRASCPCWLQVRFTDPDATGTALLLGWDEAAVFREEVRMEECRPYWTRPVGKGYLTLSACRGIRLSDVDGHRMSVPPGEEPDSLYAFSCPVDATGETAEVSVTFRKQFATVYLDILKTAGELQDYRFSVDGNTCGIDLTGLTPVPGPFHCEPAVRDGGSIVRFRIPRQADDSLSLSIRYGEAEPSDFRLGEIIRGMGYSWTADDLQDIYVSIDLTRGEVRAVIGDWEDGRNLPRVEA